MFAVEARELGTWDVAVCGGGVAGTAAALAAARNGARVILIESAGCLGGTLTDGHLGHIMDRENKGGIVRELLTFLDEHAMTCARRGPRTDESGKRIPGALVDVEGAKVFFDRVCREAGVTVLFYSRVAQVCLDEGKIARLLLSTEAGCYALSARIVVDATGSGSVAALSGCRWACGDPATGLPSPASVELCVTGMPEDYNGTENAAQKTQYNEMLLAHGVTTSAEQVTVAKQPALVTWSVGFNFQYNVLPDDIFSLSEATRHGRGECFDLVEGHKKIDGYENLYTVATGSHLGIREGRRVYGLYRLTDADILAGQRFPDGVCLVTATVDVHKLHAKDTTDCVRGVRSQPYHIPYRALVAADCRNLLLAGRCLSGDFYPHASYRMIGNMMATGEAAGFAAAQCVHDSCLPADVDGRAVSAYMRAQGYAL